MPEKLERCVEQVMGQGYPKENAYAICNAAIGGKAMPEGVSAEIWAKALESIKDVPEANTLKAIRETDNELRVGNYIILFDGRDVTGQMLPTGKVVEGLNQDGTRGQFFTKATKLDSPYTETGVLYLDWEHGLYKATGEPGQDDVLGYVDWKTAKADDRGWFVERVLNRRSRYIQWIETLVKAGLIGSSSESTPDGVRVKATGEIESWPLMRDTLTVAPYEPRMLTENTVGALKALGFALPGWAASDGAKSTTNPTQPTKGVNMVKPYELAGQYYAFESDEQGNPLGKTPEEAKAGPFATPEECIQACEKMNAGGQAGTPAASPASPAVPKPVKGTNMNDEIKSQVAELDKANKALKVQVDELTAKVGAPRLPTPGGSPAEPKDPSIFPTLGHQMMAAKAVKLDPGEATNTQRNMLKAVKDLPTVKALGINEAVDSDGGFLLQPSFSTSLFQRVYEMSEILQAVQKQEVGPGSNSYYLNQIDETSRATGSRFGGIQIYRLGEGGTKTPKRPNFWRLELKLQKLAALCYASDESLEDVTYLESEIRRLFPLEFDYVVQDEFFNGDGASQMLGVLNSGAAVSVAKETNQAGVTLVYENVLKMWSRMWAACRQNAVWYINQDVEPQLYSMSLPVGTGGLPVFLPPSGASGSPYATLFGRPIKPVEQCKTLGTTGDIWLVDPTQYLVVTKGGLKSDVSIHVAFLTDETAFRFVTRINGAPLWKTYLTPATGSTNYLSPFVKLDTRA
jgi:HK97 family phage major capsid protein